MRRVSLRGSARNQPGASCVSSYWLSFATLDDIASCRLTSKQWHEASGASWLYGDLVFEIPRRIDDAAADQLLKMSAGYTSVTLTDLAHITAAGFVLLEQQQECKVLNITGCPLVDNAIIPYLPASLEEIKIDGAGIDAAGLAALQELFPVVEFDVFECEDCGELSAARIQCIGHHSCGAFENICETCVALSENTQECRECNKYSCDECADWNGIGEGFTTCDESRCGKQMCFNCTCGDGPKEGMITCRNGDNSACTKQFCFDCASWSGPGDGMEKCEKCDLLMCDECVCSDEGLINCYECCNSYCHACAVDETVIRGDELYCIECDPGADY